MIGVSEVDCTDDQEDDVTADSQEDRKKTEIPDTSLSSARYIYLEDNSPMHKAALLRQCNKGERLSADRLRKVQGLSRTPKEAMNHSNEEM